LKPSAVVVVATVRALKMHGGVTKADLGTENVDAVKAGLVNLQRHVENMKSYGLPVVVAINHFTTDTAAENAVISEAARGWNVGVHLCRHWAEGGKGAEGLARNVVDLLEANTADFKPLYTDSLVLPEKIREIAKKIYRARDVAFSDLAMEKLARFEGEGYGALSVCMAKTQYSFSADPKLLGAPEDFTLPVRDVRLSAGAGFVVALTGDIMTMPGLPKRPAAETIGIDDKGRIEGLF
jgi:formate--tetrahydrofolate ligase